MDWLQVIVLALVQGISEFLPISSSAHLILASEVLGWQDQGLAFDVAVHIGSLLAVVIYFRKDIAQLWQGWAATLVGKPANKHGQLAWFIVMATVPLGLCGLLFESVISSHLRSVDVIAATTLLFAIGLWWADRCGALNRSLISMTMSAALIIGAAQAIALIPGTSRSGITIMAALLLGFRRDDAARFSFLLAIPAISMSGLYEMLNLWQSGRYAIDVLAVAMLLSGASAWLCIHFFLRWINAVGFTPFIVYRVVLGLLLLGFAI